jgi:hypothetical protein
MQSSAWAYPVANIAHLVGLALLAGGIMAVDLRIMGFGRRIPLKAMSDWLTPFAIVGLIIFAVSGVAMFAADAVALIRNDIFLLKLGAIGLALANALMFRHYSRFSLQAWEGQAPTWARASATASLLLWSAAIVGGRLIAYQ